MTIELTAKKVLWVTVGEALVMAAVFMGGRYSKPTETKVVTKVETKVEYKDKVKIIRLRDEAKHQEVTTTTTKGPDGTVTVTKHATTDTQTKTATNTKKSSSKKEESKTFQFSLERRDLPDWRASGLVGWDVGSLRLDPSGLAPKVYGIEVDRRIIGTVWGGVWGMSNKTAGLSVSVEF